MIPYARIEQPIKKGESMKKATLAIITRGSKVLLGLKRGGSEIGDGTLNGPGGKQEPGETLIECLVRETWEEVGITLDPTQVEKCAIITFFAGGEPSFKVHIYRTSTFTGEPCTTESMIPEWYEIGDIPELAKTRMLESDRTWFPQLIAGEKFNANVYYQEKAKGFLRIEFIPFVDHE